MRVTSVGTTACMAEHQPSAVTAGLTCSSACGVQLCRPQQGGYDVHPRERQHDKPPTDKPTNAMVNSSLTRCAPSVTTSKTHKTSE